MKTLRFIGMAVMMAVVSFGFTACSGDDDDSGSEENYKSLIVGRWLLTEVSYQDYNYEPSVDGEGWEFDTSGSFVFYYGGYELEKTWAKTWENNGKRRTGTYSIEGNRLIINVMGTTGGRHTIMNLTKDRMKLSNSHGAVLSYERFSY